MTDYELKKLLMETSPVRPGQEARAWTALQQRFSDDSSHASRWSWLYFPTARGAFVGASIICALLLLGNSISMSYRPVSYASANSESPGIYATSFYSRSAQAQVVWLNGLAPATDKPTYLDPTTESATPGNNPTPPRRPNSL